MPEKEGKNIDLSARLFCGGRHARMCIHVERDVNFPREYFGDYKMISSRKCKVNGGLIFQNAKSMSSILD